MSTKKKLIVAVACLLVATCSLVTGTLAWLTDTTEEVTNVFTPSTINITLTETWNTDANGDGTNESWSAKMVPGATIEKDPTITVLANSEACYLFVKISEVNNFEAFMTYAVADGWTALDGVDGVYYREVAAGANDQPFAVLKDNKVTVKGEGVTKEMMDALYEPNAAQPTLTFTAYACQKDNIADAAAAWAILNPTNP